MACLRGNVHNRVVILGPCDISRGAGLHLADESGVVIHQNVQGLQEGDDTRRCAETEQPQGECFHQAVRFVASEQLDNI